MQKLVTSCINRSPKKTTGCGNVTLRYRWCGWTLTDRVFWGLIQGARWSKFGCWVVQKGVLGGLKKGVQWFRSRCLKRLFSGLVSEYYAKM